MQKKVKLKISHERKESIGKLKKIKLESLENTKSAKME